MRKSRYLSFLLIFLLYPNLVAAHDFHQNDSLFFNTHTGIYRQKTVDRPWQLVSLPATATIKQSVSFGEMIYLVVEEDAKQTLWRQQDRPLQFSRLSGVNQADTITVKLVGDRLVIFSATGLTVKIQLLNLTGSLVTALPELVDSVDQLSRVVDVASELHYLQQSGSTVTVWRYDGGWISVSQPSCQNSQVLTKPLIGLFCQDGTIIYSQSADHWSTLSLAPLRQVYSSELIMGGWDLADEHLFHVWANGQVTSTQLPSLSASQIDQVVVVGRRVLLRKIDGNWFELIWQNATPIIAEITLSAGGSVIRPDNGEALFINSIPPLFSVATTNWQTLTVVGQFSSARQTPLGYLIWNSGSLTQFAPTGSFIFTKVNPWSSTTSPIQAVEIGSSTSFVSVMTQSGTGNVNLYKTTDFTHWSRITLPTKPTFSPTILQARLLAPGSLVELSGVITVAPKVVDSEVLYLEDTTAGLQVFLSQTTGLLPTTTKITAIATGEISTSQTKRVLLSTLSDLELGSASTWTPPTINADQAVDWQGRSVLLKGSVTDIETDHLTIGSLKLHFVGAKNQFQKDDQAQWLSVIDWNSSSGKVEAWATSSNYQLLSRFQAPPPVVSPPSPSSLTTVSSKVKKTTAATKKSATTLATNLPVKTVSSLSQSTDTPVMVASIQSTDSSNDSRTISMSAVSLLAGLLSFRGRRFRRWLPN